MRTGTDKVVQVRLGMLLGYWGLSYGYDMFRGREDCFGVHGAGVRDGGGGISAEMNWDEDVNEDRVLF